MASLASVRNNVLNLFSDIPSDSSHIYNLAGSSAALFLAMQQEPFIVVVQTEEAALAMNEEIQFFRALMQGISGNVFFLPETNGPETSGKRAQVAQLLRQGDSVVTSKKGVESPLWQSDDLERNMLSLAAGQEMERDRMEKELVRLGYKRVSIVMDRGEFSTKGWLIDVFPVIAEFPVRVEFFGDEIEQMKSFDIGSQRSMGKLDSLIIMPMTEPSSGTGITSLINARLIFSDCDPTNDDAWAWSGVPLPEGMTGEGPSKEEAGRKGPLCLSSFDIKGSGYNAGALSMRGLGIYPDERKSFLDLTDSLSAVSRDARIVIISSSEGQAERMKEILFEGGIVAPIIDRGEVADYEGAIAVTRGTISSGFFLPGLMLLTEKEIFGERPQYRALKKSRVSDLLASIDDIAPGDLVVHKDHGVGRFAGLQKQSSGGYENDLIVLEYSGGDRLYIPLYNIDKIKKYGTEEGASPVLDRLGGKTWLRRRERVRKAVREMADRLLKLYSERETAVSFSFSPDTELHREFYDFFPYEETPDQIRAAAEISRDMEAERPMDRLLCGDVGYGKTEVAMRAAFKAVYDGKQVAVLVPTTILCEQHYYTFKSRFSAFPVRIDYLSRFKAKRERDMTMAAVARGEVDIIVGTHALLAKKSSFSNLGLLIVDEEHRFGVGQKERIKELKKGVDVLSMTATPIPRTLHMAISGIRGMSVIETPPEERLAVRSVVSVFDQDLIKEAIERELRRGGQVLFVHNTVFDIEKIARWLKGILPGTRFDIAHGQMAERKLEDVMLKFVRGETEVLVSTTIIGSGIDIPTANTIIIDRADKIGLSDLYQLRGRVGRSSVRAYAYFLIPGKDMVSEEAKKRLRAISEMSYLGAGFRLAMRDLEMRGAGNLLGAEQSGHIHAVGFDLYVEMLEKAVAELKGMDVKEEPEPVINLKVNALIPESYVEDMTLRLSLYRRIAGAGGNDGLEDLKSEMTDRFGDLPEEAMKLLEIMKLKILAKRLSVLSVSEAGHRIRFVFSEATPVPAERILGLQGSFKNIRFHKDGFEIDLKGAAKEGALGASYQALVSLGA